MLNFGTAGVPHSARSQDSVHGIERVAELGLTCMEMEFVRGVTMTDVTARAVAATARRNRITLTAHAPYYINLNSPDAAKVKASQARILHTARVAHTCGAASIVFHAGFYMGGRPEAVYAVIKSRLAEILYQLRTEGNQVWLRPEVTGKPSQFGSVDEVVVLSAELDGVAPCIDFAHCHARDGKTNSYYEFANILGRVKKQLGQAYLDNLHIHVAGIVYTAKGERRHVNLEESDLAYPELLRALKDNGVGGTLICESPNLEQDALLLKATYAKV